MPHLGIAIYVWGRSHQNRLIAECLGPLARDLRDAGLIDRFWFDRFDARGPHLFAVYGVPGELAPVGEAAAAAVARYLAESPSTEVLSEEQVAAHHAGCRGKIQCEADGYPGLAGNNTFHWFEHPGSGYPFWLLSQRPRSEEILDLYGDLALWAAGQLAPAPDRVPMATAIGWAAALDRELGAAGLDAAEYWRYHATTLILPLAERLRTEEDEVLRSLPGSIGERNRETFARVWSEAGGAAGSHPQVQRLVELAAPLPEADTPRERWRLLRESVHITLKQLGIPVNLHIPLLLFGWHHNLTLAESR